MSRPSLGLLRSLSPVSRPSVMTCHVPPSDSSVLSPGVTSLGHDVSRPSLGFLGSLSGVTSLGHDVSRPSLGSLAPEVSPASLSLSPLAACPPISRPHLVYHVPCIIMSPTSCITSHIAHHVPLPVCPALSRPVDSSPAASMRETRGRDTIGT